MECEDGKCRALVSRFSFKCKVKKVLKDYIFAFLIGFGLMTYFTVKIRQCI
jgi:hypothetical protein